MYDFVINLVMFVSLAVVMFMLARALPRIPDEEFSGAVPVNRFDKMMKRLPMERIDTALHSFVEKMLRKSKIVVSKIDNVINNYLTQVKKTSPAAKEQLNLKEKMEAMSAPQNGQTGAPVEKTPDNQ